LFSFHQKTEWRFLMEIIRGKKSLELNMDGLQMQIAGYKNVLLDLGTGDGRFVHRTAGKYPDRFVIGLDACRENLREGSRAQPANALFVIASAQALPFELSGLCTGISINFPWGSLLRGLLDSDSALLDGLARVARPNADVTIRLNGGALAEAGWDAEAGAWQVHDSLWAGGLRVQAPALMDQAALRACPTTWAKRLAFGRDPRGWIISARFADRQEAFFKAKPAELTSV
jgi:16S rRNA (adenine(1408)-N(1))-methyltransferase